MGMTHPELTSLSSLLLSSLSDPIFDNPHKVTIHKKTDLAKS